MNPRLLSLVTWLMLIPSLLAGQSAPARGAATRVPVTVVLVDRLPHAGAPFVVLRRSDATPRDVILLPTSADADLLSEAVRMLLVARQAGGDTSATTAALRARPQGGRAARRVFPWAQRVLSDLRRAPSRALPGVGVVPAVEIWLPPQKRRPSAR